MAGDLRKTRKPAERRRVRPTRRAFDAPDDHDDDLVAGPPAADRPVEPK